MRLKTRLASTVIKAAILGVIAALLAFALAMDRSAPEPLRIAVTQRADAGVDVVFNLPRSVRALSFEALPGDYRGRQWRLAGDDFVVTQNGDSDAIVRRDGDGFNRVVLVAAPHDERLEKNYQPIAPYGDGGVLFYTGHFTPRDGQGRRVDAAFSFRPAPGANVVSFGAHADALDDWRSPTGQSAFIYMGPLAPAETPSVIAVIDPDAPEWVRDEFDALTPLVFARLSQAFGAALEVKPTVFLAAPLGEDEGRLRYAGDATQGQFQITLEGRAWTEPSDKARGIFRRATIHEAVHLWQAPARPKGEATPDWIHEGAADAIAAETLVALGLWDEAAFAADLAAARAECAQRLRAGTLKSAKARGDVRAAYACGHVIAEAVSRAEGAPASDFWRAFIARAADEGGYDEATFYDLVAERSGDQGFALALRRFVSTPAADGGREIDRLLAAAGAPRKRPPLAPVDGR